MPSLPLSNSGKFLSPQKKSCTHSQSLLTFLTNTNLLLVSMDIKYKGDHTVCGLLCLAPFISQLVPFLLYSWEMEFIVSWSGFCFPSPICSISSVKRACVPSFFAAWFTFSSFIAVRHKPLSSQLAVRGCPPKGTHFEGEVSCRILAVAILAPSYNPRRVPVRRSA